jgi:hypothetical protein
MCDRPNCVIDLDNTIICSITPTDLKKLNKDINLDYTDMKRYYRIFHRPHLQDFLDFIFANFNVTVWTAASKDYALFIVKNIILTKKDRKLKMMLYDDNCEQSESRFKTATPKDLRYLYFFQGYNKDNTFIVDDLDEVYKINKNQVLRADYFDAEKSNAPNDDFLKRAIKKMENMLEKYHEKKGGDVCKLRS